MQATKLTNQSVLPLTCSRTGTCCHGKQVLLNPWELFRLAKEKKITPREFRDLYCDFGGIRLQFNGKIGYKNQQACSQYIDNFGCSVHLGRPLSCRLYPLGRQIQSSEVHYIYEGSVFPCLEGCPEVSQLPQMSVGEYLNGQLTDNFEKAQDAYLELLQNIADIGFELLLESGLSESGDKKTLQLWRKMGVEPPEEMAKRIGSEWMDSLMIPDIFLENDDSVTFVKKHHNLLLLRAQEEFGACQTNQEFHEASVLIMGVALHLVRAIGASPKELAEHWINTAKQHGAQE